MRELVLASTSPYRQELFGRLGLPFSAVPPRFEELLDQDVPPDQLVQTLALGKALSLADNFTDAVIIGSDQVFVSGGRILGKPGTPERAFAQLRSMSGQTHTFYTGLAVVDRRQGTEETACVTFSVTLRSLTDEELRTYIRRENPVDCAGSFKIEGLGIALMEKMEGDDFTALVGLPLIRLTDMLIRCGINPLGPRATH